MHNESKICVLTELKPKGIVHRIYFYCKTMNVQEPINFLIKNYRGSLRNKKQNKKKTPLINSLFYSVSVYCKHSMKVSGVGPT